MSNTANEKTHLRRKAAALRLSAAIILAAVLLWVTDFAIGDILSGPRQVSSMDNLPEGSYVSANIGAIYDFYAEDYTASADEVTAWYAVIPMDGQLVTLRLPARYFSSAETVINDTYDYINGFTGPQERYFAINGSVTAMSEELETRFYDWFAGNSGWMSDIGLVPAGADAGDYLSPYMIIADNIGPFYAVVTYIMTAIALCLLLYAVAVGIRLAAGGYKAKSDSTAPASVQEPVSGNEQPCADITEAPEEKDVF